MGLNKDTKKRVFRCSEIVVATSKKGIRNRIEPTLEWSPMSIPENFSHSFQLYRQAPSRPRPIHNGHAGGLGSQTHGILERQRCCSNVITRGRNSSGTGINSIQFNERPMQAVMWWLASRKSAHMSTIRCCQCRRGVGSNLAFTFLMWIQTAWVENKCNL